MTVWTPIISRPWKTKYYNWDGPNIIRTRTYSTNWFSVAKLIIKSYTYTSSNICCNKKINLLLPEKFQGLHINHENKPQIRYGTYTQKKCHEILTSRRWAWVRSPWSSADLRPANPNKIFNLWAAFLVPLKKNIKTSKAWTKKNAKIIQMRLLIIHNLKVSQ